MFRTVVNAGSTLQKRKNQFKNVSSERLIIVGGFGFWEG